MRALKATILDDDHFRLLAIPFDGPIKSDLNARGVDMDGQWFDPEVNPKKGWLKDRPVVDVDWHHGEDALGNPDRRPFMGATIFGKAVLDDEPEEDGWWVDVWLDHGQRRLNLIKRINERGGLIFGSAETLPRLARLRTVKGEVMPWRSKVPGAIVEWPYLKQTLSTSPQNTNSVLRSVKATLDDLTAEGFLPTDAFFDDLARYIDDLSPSPTAPASELAAKAGRVLAARNEAKLREALAAMSAVLEELDKYTPKDEEHEHVS